MDTCNIIEQCTGILAENIDSTTPNSYEQFHDSIYNNALLIKTASDGFYQNINWCTCIPDWVAITIAVTACIFTILSYFLIKNQVVHEINGNIDAQRTNQGILNGVLDQNKQQKEIMKTIKTQTDKVITFSMHTKVETKTKECYAICIAQLTFLKNYFETQAGRVCEDIEQAKFDTNQTISSILQNAIIIKANSKSFNIPTDILNVVNKCISLKDFDEKCSNLSALDGIINDIESWIKLLSDFLETHTNKEIQ